MTQRQRTCERKGSVGTSQMFQKTVGTFFRHFFVGLAFAKPTQLTAVWFLPRKASTIWCFTTDSEVTWQECQPIGVLRPACKHGFLSAVRETAPSKRCQRWLETTGFSFVLIIWWCCTSFSTKSLRNWLSERKVLFLPSHLSCSFVRL